MRADEIFRFKSEGHPISGYMAPLLLVFSSHLSLAEHRDTDETLWHHWLSREALQHGKILEKHFK